MEYDFEYILLNSTFIVKSLEISQKISFVKSNGLWLVLKRSLVDSFSLITHQKYLSQSVTH